MSTQLGRTGHKRGLIAVFVSLRRLLEIQGHECLARPQGVRRETISNLP